MTAQVLGVIVGLFGLLLFLKWQMMSLIWLWAPLMGIGGVSVLLVFTSECGVYASKNCGCLVSLSNLFGLIVGGVELVVAIVRHPMLHQPLPPRTHTPAPRPRGRSQRPPPAPAPAPRQLASSPARELASSR